VITGDNALTTKAIAEKQELNADSVMEVKSSCDERSRNAKTIHGTTLFNPHVSRQN
jgi:magnesium-transporting ATPase (P-type)